jgi:hypothetical protein
MTPIEIPYATTPIRLFMGFACLFIAAFIFGWFTPKFVTFLRQFRTVKASIAIAGAFIYAVMFGFALIPSAIFIELVENPKTTISDAGIFEDATVLHRSTRIGWNEIQKVSCLISRSGRVTSLTIRASDGRKISVGNSGTAVLGPTYDLLHARLGDGIVGRCGVPFRQ